MSYDFDGVDDYIVAVSGATLGPTISASAWFNADTMGEINGGTIIGHSTGVELERWKIHFNQIGTNKLSLAAKFGTTWGAWDMTTGFATLPGWKWVMATWTVGLANTPTLYVFDGGWIQTMTVGNGKLTVSAAPSGTDPIDGGNIDLGSNYGQIQAFDGRIGEVGVWTRILTEAEALAVWTYGVRAITNGRYLYQPLHGDARDYSGNNRHGTISGAVNHPSSPPIYPMGVSPTAGQARLRSTVAVVEDLMIVPAGRLDSGPGGTARFLPYNGNKIPINGVNVTIPPGGVSISGAGLTNYTNYYIYAYLNAGNLALEASTTGHSADAATGIEIKTGDPTRSLVGMVRRYSSNTLDSGSYWRGILSWYNRQPIGLARAFTAARAITSVGTFVVVHSEIDLEFLTWGDEAISLHFHGSVENNTAGAATYSAIGINGTPHGGLDLHNLPVAGNWIPHTVAWVTTQPETGYYVVSVFAQVNVTSTATFHPWGALSATIRG